MAIGGIVTLGIGAPGSVPDIILHGLSAATVVDLTGGETGYLYDTPTAVDPTYTAPVPSASPTLTAPTSTVAEEEYTYNP